MLTESLESFIQPSALGSDLSRGRVHGGDKLEQAVLESPPIQTRGFCLLRVKNMAAEPEEIQRNGCFYRSL